MSDIMERHDGMGDLHDERLRRALAHAPDHTAAPNWRVRKAILDHAHEAVDPSLASAPAVPERSWWQRLLGLGGADGGGRMPWNAAFATVLVAVLVTVLWQREPVPGARPDGEVAAPPAAQRAEAPASPPAAPAAPVPEAAPALVPAPAPPAVERALPSSEDIPGTPLPPPEPEPAPTAKAARPARAPERPVASPSEPDRRQAEEAALSASAAGSGKEARKREAPAAQPVPPVAMAPAPGAARDANEARPPATAAPAPHVAESADMPSFAALSQWSRMTITPARGGAGRTLSRGEAMELNALLGSAAISAVGPQPLAGAPEWRVTLERGNGEVLATFELGRNQVRWREGPKPATTGAPSAASLAALREALQRAVAPPAQPPVPLWRPAQPQAAQPQGQPAEGGTPPPAPTR